MKRDINSTKWKEALYYLKFIEKCNISYILKKQRYPINGVEKEFSKILLLFLRGGALGWCLFYLLTLICTSQILHRWSLYKSTETNKQEGKKSKQDQQSVSVPHMDRLTISPPSYCHVSLPFLDKLLECMDNVYPAVISHNSLYKPLKLGSCHSTLPKMMFNLHQSQTAF